MTGNMTWSSSELLVRTAVAYSLFSRPPMNLNADGCMAGYTGQLTAEHVATHLPTNLKWAVAGRSESKLQTTVAECQKLNPDRLPPSMYPVGLFGRVGRIFALICI